MTTPTISLLADFRESWRQPCRTGSHKSTCVSVMSENNGNCHKLLTTDLPETDGLSDQQRIFVDAYLRTWNASQAAEEAKYAWPRSTGAKLLQKPAIRAAIDEELKNHHIGTNHVLARLGEMANVSLADFTDEDGQVDIEKARGKGHLVQKVQVQAQQKALNR